MKLLFRYEVAGDNQSLDFRSSFVDLHYFGVTVVSLDVGWREVAGASVYLNGFVGIFDGDS